jgi:hypothetical protein
MEENQRRARAVGGSSFTAAAPMIGVGSTYFC